MSERASTHGGKRVRVLLVDGQPLFRRGVASALAEAGIFDVVGEAHDGHAAIPQVRALAPDVVLMDVSRPGPSAIEATSDIAAAAPTVRILAMTAPDEDGRGLHAIKVGADRFVPKDVGPEHLVAAVRAVVRGEPFVTPSMAVEILHDSGGARPGNGASGAAFTARERDVLHLLAGGVVNGAIAAQLRVADSAVKKHLRSIVDKLRAESVGASAPAADAGARGTGDAPRESWRQSRRLALSAADRDLLQQILRSPIIPHRIALRAHIVLGAADGWSNYRIARECETSRPTVLVWRRRYAREGVRGLLTDAPRPGRPPGERSQPAAPAPPLHLAALTALRA